MAHTDTVHTATRLCDKVQLSFSTEFTHSHLNTASALSHNKLLISSIVYKHNLLSFFQKTSINILPARLPADGIPRSLACEVAVSIFSSSRTCHC